MSEWIKCSERLPEVDEYVLIRQRYTRDTMISRIAQWGYWVEQCENLVVNGDATASLDICMVKSPSEYERVTHWMPLPQPPEDV